MKNVNTFNVTPGSGSPGELIRPVSFDAGKLCTRIRLKAAPVLTSADASAYTLTLADVTALIAAIFSNITIKFGEVEPQVIENATPIARLRELFAVMALRDWIVSVGTNNGQLNAYTTGGANKIQVPATGGGTVSPVLEVCRSFVFERMLSKLYQFCPGTSQMRQLQLSVNPGSTFTADSAKVTLANSGQVLVTVQFDTIPAKYDQWANPPILYRTELTGLEQHGPNGGGALLATWEYTNAAASQALTLYEMRADEQDQFQGLVQFSDVYRDQQDTLPLGAFDPNTLVSVLYTTDDVVNVENLQTAEDFKIRQPNSDLSPMKSAWLVIPRQTTAGVDQAGRNLLSGPNARSNVKLATRHAADNQPASAALASISPLVIMGPEHPKYQLAPGRVFEKGQQPRNHIPDALINAAHVAAQAHGTEAASTAAEAKAVHDMANAMPGVPSPNQQAGEAHASPEHQAILDYFVKKTSAGAAAAEQRKTALLAHMRRTPGK